MPDAAFVSNCSLDESNVLHEVDYDPDVELAHATRTIAVGPRSTWTTVASNQ